MRLGVPIACGSVVMETLIVLVKFRGLSFSTVDVAGVQFSMRESCSLAPYKSSRELPSSLGLMLIYEFLV